MHVWINEQVERLQGNLTNKKKDIITNCWTPTRKTNKSNIPSRIVERLQGKLTNQIYPHELLSAYEQNNIADFGRPMYCVN